MATVAARQSSTGTIGVSKITLAQPYLGVVPLVTGSGNAPNAIATATLTGTATSTVYLCGLIVTGSGATIPLAVLVTVTGLLGGTRSFTYCFDGDPKKPNQSLNFNFDPPLPAADINTPIVITVPAGGSGNLNSMVTAYGFYSTPTLTPPSI